MLRASPLIATLELVAALPNNVEKGIASPQGGSKKESDQRLVEHEALSYCWGDRAKTKTMTVDGTPFGISANLEAALTQLRKPDEERILWADAICINQNDDAEKRREVACMRAIYYGARRVVWLGPAEPDSGAGIDFAEEIYKRFCSYCDCLGLNAEGEGVFDWITETERFEVVESLLLSCR